MSGETDLGTLMRGLTAVLDEDLYVFATVQRVPDLGGIIPRMTFHEAEGTTLILRQSEAQTLGLPHEFPCRMITLDVHSALEAVGFIARIATELARHDMGVNPVSGFFHDHLFVPDGRQDDALRILAQLSET